MFTSEELTALIDALAGRVVDDWDYYRKHAEDDELPELRAAIARREALLKKLRSLEDGGL